jgi:hypothetical protein
VAKQTGIVSNLYVDDADISGDVGAVDSISQTRTQLDVTGINKDHMERLPGVSDGSLSFTSFFNTTGAHAELAAMSTAARIVTVALGTAIGASAASLVGAEMTYSPVRGQDGSLVAQTEFNAHINGGGLEWGNLHTAGGKETFAAAGSAATLNGGTATTTGAAAYLHLFSIGSGTATFKIQDSSDDSSFTDVSGLAFTAASAGTQQRVATAGTATLRQYTKVVATGTFGTAVVAVNLIRGL